MENGSAARVGMTWAAEQELGLARVMIEITHDPPSLQQPVGGR